MHDGNSDEKDRSEKDKSGKKKVRTSENRKSGGHKQVTEDVMETTFQKTRLIKRGTEAQNANSDSSDSEIPYAEWRIMRQCKDKDVTGTSTSADTKGKQILPSITASSAKKENDKEIHKLVSFWNSIGTERPDKPKTMMELEAQTEMVSLSTPKETEGSGTTPIVEVDLTADISREDDQEISVVSRKFNHKTRKDQSSIDNDTTGLDNLARLIDRTLLAELITEDTWMDRLRRVIERNDRHTFEMMYHAPTLYGIS